MITPETVVRLTTSSYVSSNGAFRQTKELRTLKRKTPEFDLLENETQNMSPDDIVVVNLYNMPDGVYQLAMTNESYDWETGHLDDYELILIPYTDDDE